jgi:hypothetical protein
MSTLTIQENTIAVSIVENNIALNLIPQAQTVTLSNVGIQGAKGDKGDTGASGGLDPISLVFGEAPTGLIDGVNATFQSQYNFIPESVSVFLNGMRLKVIADYQTSGARTINLNVSPTVAEMIQIDYLRG